MTRRAILAIIAALIPQIIRDNRIIFEQPKEFKVSLLTPLVIIVDNQEFKFTPREIAEILKGN